MIALPSSDVRIHDPFWSPRLQMNAGPALRHQWKELESSGCIDNFRVAAGEKPDGFREGWFFADSDAYKWLEAASLASRDFPDPGLAAAADGVVALLARAQEADGYLFTYNSIHFPGRRWAALAVEHELYCLGHLIEAAVSRHEALGKDDLIEVAQRAADLLLRDFSAGGPDRVCGHEEVELALLRLGGCLGRADYSALARSFLERRGAGRFLPLALIRQFSDSMRRTALVAERRAAWAAGRPDRAPRVPPPNAARKPPLSTLRWYIEALTGRYAQQDRPVRARRAPEGHAVRFGYLETALARLARTAPDPTLQPSLEAAWDRMVSRRMYVTGGLGAVPGSEGFGRDFELDPRWAYAETCASLAAISFSGEMLLLMGEARYADLVEWELYNGAGVGMGLQGDAYFYNNPLASDGGLSRRPWFAVPCCPSNISRCWAGLGSRVAFQDGDRIHISQYIGSSLRVVPASGALGETKMARISIESGLPWRDGLRLRVEGGPVELMLRIPSWAAAPALVVDGAARPLPAAPPGPAEAAAGGYDPRTARWAPVRLGAAGGLVELSFGMPILARRASPRVRGHAGKVALSRGPLLYCLESVDNPGIDLDAVELVLPTAMAEEAPGLLGGITIIRARGTRGEGLVFIPYALWGNRGESAMRVWVRARGAPPA